MTSIHRLTSQIFNQYDKNNDGIIQLRGRFGRNESSRMVRDVTSTPEYDIITLSKHTRRGLFQAADTNHDGRVTRRELSHAVAAFDKNNDGHLKNHGPFWNRRGELKRFENTYPERKEIVHSDWRRKPTYPPHNPWDRPYHPGRPWHRPNHPSNTHGHRPVKPGRRPHHGHSYQSGVQLKTGVGLSVGIRIGR